MIFLSAGGIMDLIKVYYTTLPVISTALEFSLVIEGKASRAAVPHSMSLIRGQESVIQHRLFEEVKNLLGHGKFFLIPSVEETELVAFQEARMYHPENFPMDSDESIGGFGSMREDS